MNAKVLYLMTILLITLAEVRQTEAGSITVRWWRDEDGFHLEVDILIGANSIADDMMDELIQPSRVSYAYDQRRKRSAEMIDERGKPYVNGTADDLNRMFQAHDVNCDGYIDVTEWPKLEEFKEILHTYDTNDDLRVSLMELEGAPIRVHPDKEFMVMPMDMFDEMESMMGNSQHGQDGKERKTTE